LLNVSYICDETIILKPPILCLDSIGGKAARRTRTTDVAALSRRRIISPTARSPPGEAERRRYNAAGKMTVTIL
jgi:hypothetical protein